MMDPKRAQLVLVILIFCQKVTPSAGKDVITKNEGDRVEIKCKITGAASTTTWFRMLDRSGMEFIGSFDIHGKKKTTTTTPSSNFEYTKMNQNILVLTSFKREKDSGLYNCAAFRNAELIFGEVTQLVGEKAPEPIVPTAGAGATETLCTTAAPCVCNNGKKGETGLLLACNPMILGPLAGGCGLLLLLLIITTLYCNKMRTRRCPHHYKRKPRAMPAGNK